LPRSPITAAQTELGLVTRSLHLSDDQVAQLRKATAAMENEVERATYAASRAEAALYTAKHGQEAPVNEVRLCMHCIAAPFWEALRIH
jgi:hypothetical protein